MECLTAAVLVVAVVVLVLGVRRSKGLAQVEERQRQETAALRAVVFRLQEMIAELERRAGVPPPTPVAQPVGAPAAPPVVAAAPAEAPAPVVPPPAPPPARPSPPWPPLPPPLSSLPGR